jgi:hypothetical protein
VPRDGGTVTFDFAGCRIVVDAGGEVRVDPDP